MESLNKNNLINTAIKGLGLFFGLVVFLFVVLGEKSDNKYYVYKFYYDDYLFGEYENNFYFAFTFLFSYIEILALFYLRDKTINSVSTHIISGIYSFIVAFILYLNIDYYDSSWEYKDGCYLRFSNFIWLLFSIETTLLILTYKEKDLRNILSNKQILKLKKKNEDNQQKQR